MSEFPFPKGAVVRIGDAPGISKSAIGLIVRLQANCRYGDEVAATVLENNNEWWGKEVYHKFDSRYDKMLPEYDSNETFYEVLKSLDEYT